MSKSTPQTKGQKKLKSLGIDLPLLPVSAPSDLPKPSELMEMRYKVAKGVQPATELARKEKISAEVWIRHQERLTLDVLSDGEMNRGDRINFFAKKIEGFESGGTVRCFENNYYQKPVIRGKLTWKSSFIVEDWRVYQRMTHKPMKAVLTGPYTLMDYSFNDYYPTREAACADLVVILKKEINALADAGAKIIEIQEPALSSKPDEFSMIVDAIKELTNGLKSYVILSHSFGRLAPIWEKLQRLPIDNLSLDLTNSDVSEIALLKKRKDDMDLSIGIVNSHAPQLESASQLLFRLKEIRKSAAVDNLWLTAPMGLKTRTIDQATDKLKALISVAAKERGKK